MCADLPLIQHPSNAVPGIPPENAFDVLDETGMKCGSAAVVEFVNHTLLPERPLNYYISINAMTERAFDMLMGAVLARSMQMRELNPNLLARIYAPCKPHESGLLRNFQEFGFRNDDAVIRMRRILSDTDRVPNPPVGCVVAPVVLQDQEDYDGLLRRVNAYSVTAKSSDWIFRLQQEQLFSVYGVWQEDRLLGEMVLTAYGAEGSIEMIYARPEFRRRGIGSALIACAREVLLKNGIRSLNAEVWRRNRSAMALFEENKFESVTPVILYPGIDV